MKKIFFMLIVLISIPCKAFTYETNVHMQITSRAISLSTIEQYLSKNLNISLSDKFSDGINRRPASEWLELGSVWEDNPPRWLNHFYDPTTGLGLHDILSGKPSLQWAKDYANNEWDWNRARYNYSSALTSTNKTDRENAFARVFRALGHIIHLIEDKTVPAHVRNDAHPYFFENYLQQQRDMYEKYTRDAVNDELNGTDRIPHLKYDGYSVVDLTTFNALATVWINSGKGLAEFTNRNFVSRDTNFDDPAYSNYNTPASIGEGITTERVYDPDYGWIYVNVKYLQGYATDIYRSGQSSPISRLSAFSYFDYEANKYLGKPGVYSLNNYVHKDYASLLIPRAVGYSAGLLNYFFRGSIDMVRDTENDACKYVVYNLSNEYMEGTFGLYYDDASGNRNNVASGDLTANAGEPSNPVTLDITEDLKNKSNYILVFKGTMGNETGAVVADAKVTPFTSSCGKELTISGAGTTSKNSTELYIVGGCTGCSDDVTWEVSGAGAKKETSSDDIELKNSIKLTTDDTACGTITITASCPGCGIDATKTVTISDTLEIIETATPDCYAVKDGTGSYTWSISKGTIDENGCANLTGQCGTATITVTDANGCTGEKELNISAENCSSLTIVNENGTPATDTILRGGSNDYKTAGKCCENITWSVSATSGSSKGSAAIASNGVLTASGACGTLIVTATCAGCGTSATQDVRVTNCGKYVSKSICYENYSGMGGSICAVNYFYSGRYRYYVSTRTGEATLPLSCTRNYTICPGACVGGCHQTNGIEEYVGL